MTDNPEVKDKTTNALVRAEAFAIENAEQFVQADRFCASLKDLEKEVCAGYDDQISKAHELHKSLVAKKNSFLTPISAARNILKSKMAAWQEAQEAKRLALEAQLREMARKKDEEAALYAAELAEKAGDKAAADAIISAPIQASAIVLPKMTPKTATTFQTRWDFRITDANAIPRQFMKPDEVTIRRIVQAMKGAANIPGIEVFSRKV